MGSIERAFPNPTEGRPTDEPIDLTSADPIVLEVEFSDVSSVVVWRARDRYVEHVQRVVDGDPIWDYAVAGDHELEIVTDLGRVDDRPVGWVRRTWRRFW